VVFSCRTCCWDDAGGFGINDELSLVVEAAVFVVAFDVGEFCGAGKDDCVASVSVPVAFIVSFFPSAAIKKQIKLAFYLILEAQSQIFREYA
jgi:hypothetical protein